MRPGAQAAMQAVRRAGAVVVVLALFLGGGSTCKRPPTGRVATSGTTSKADSKDPALTESLAPAETLQRVHQYRMSGQLSLIEPYLLPEQRPHIIELLQSMDQLIAAGAALRDAVEEHIGPASALVFDRSGAADNLGIFSKNVQILGEKIDGETATVTLQIARRVPLETVAMVRHDGRWVIREETPIPGVAEAMRSFAGVDQAMARELARKKMTVEELQKELNLQRAPIQRRLADIYRQARSSP